MQRSWQGPATTNDLSPRRAIASCEECILSGVRIRLTLCTDGVIACVVLVLAAFSLSGTRSSPQDLVLDEATAAVYVELIQATVRSEFANYMVPTICTSSQHSA